MYLLAHFLIPDKSIEKSLSPLAGAAVFGPVKAPGNFRVKLRERQLCHFLFGLGHTRPLAHRTLIPQLVAGSICLTKSIIKLMH